MSDAAPLLVVGSPAGPAGALVPAIEAAFETAGSRAGIELLDPDVDRAVDGTWSLAARQTLAAVAWDVVVLADAIPEPEDRAVEVMDPAWWDRLAERPLRRSWASLQAVRAEVTATTVVVVTSAIGFVGAPGQVAQAAAAEGQRMLAKSAARQWTADGLLVWCAAVHPRLLGAPRAEPLTDAAPAAGSERDLLADLASTIEALRGPSMAHHAGTTFVIDGAGVMAP